MATYVIGDVQGCYEELLALLEHIHFDTASDRLWFVGDLVNRGPASLSVLRFVYHLKEKAIVTLGNHDLHVLAVAEGHRTLHKEDTIQDILSAADRTVLLTWLRKQRLFYEDSALHAVMVHAGIYPGWTLEEAAEYAKEVEDALHSDHYLDVLANLSGNLPSRFSSDLKGSERYRFIVNAFTRMRYCDETLACNFTEYLAPSEKGASFAPKPWFDLWPEENREAKDVIFGHWAALRGNIQRPHFYGLDTGCVWGGELTAMRLSDKKRFSVASLQPSR